MAKQFTFNEVFWNGCTVHFDKAAGGPGTLIVNVLSYQFFSRTVFSGDQNPRISRCHTGNHLTQILDRLAFAKDPNVFFYTTQELSIFSLQARHIDEVIENNCHLIYRKRLFDEIVG